MTKKSCGAAAPCTLPKGHVGACGTAAPLGSDCCTLPKGHVGEHEVSRDGRLICGWYAAPSMKEIQQLREENAKLRVECKQVADLFDQEATKRIRLAESFDKLESRADAQALCLLRLREWQKLAEGVIWAARDIAVNGGMTVNSPDAVTRMAALSRAIAALDGKIAPLKLVPQVPAGRPFGSGK